MLQRIVCKWIERFKNGRTSVKHGEGTGRQSTSITDADMERVYGMILQNTVETLKKLNFEVLEHPLYSLELTPSDYLFGPLKQACRGRRFTTDQQLNVTVHAWLVCQPKTFYSEGIKQIVRWWTKCIVKQGDCAEKYVAVRSLLLFL
jgi:hypothetical protein